MNTAHYAARNANAHQRMLDAAERIAQTEGFSDVVDTLKAANHKDRQVEVLFQREAFATILERVADHLAGLNTRSEQPKQDAPERSKSNKRDA